MKEYNKIQTVYKRDEKTKRIIEGDYSLPEFEYLRDNIWVFTEKVDGTNVRVHWNGESVVLGGRTKDAQMPMFLISKLNEIFEGTVRKQTFIKQFGSEPTDVTLYGEGYGAKIQKGGGNYNPNWQDFVLFDVRVGDWWLQRKDVDEIAEVFGLKIVPIIGEVTLADAIEQTRKGIKSQWGDFTAEGIVARPKTELRSRNGERIITKIKNKDFKI